jgi:hypothetical protein
LKETNTANRLKNIILMELKFLGRIKSPFEQEIFFEEKKYERALKSNAKFYVLKAIRLKIKMLKLELYDKRMHNMKDGHSQLPQD